MSSKSVGEEVSSKSVPQECQIRVSSKGVSPVRSAIVSSKGVLQECHLSVSSQQVGSLENLCFSTYVSAFGFVGFILFYFFPGVLRKSRFMNLHELWQVGTQKDDSNDIPFFSLTFSVNGLLCRFLFTTNWAWQWRKKIIEQVALPNGPSSRVLSEICWRPCTKASPGWMSNLRTKHFGQLVKKKLGTATGAGSTCNWLQYGEPNLSLGDFCSDPHAGRTGDIFVLDSCSVFVNVLFLFPLFWYVFAHLLICVFLVGFCSSQSDLDPKLFALLTL